MSATKSVSGVGIIFGLAVLFGSATAAAQEREPCIGISAATSGAQAYGGEAIRMGVQLAIEDINEAGGVLGQELSYNIYDEAGSPPRGVDNLRRIAERDNCIFVFGGYHSTVQLAMVDPIHQIGIPYMAVISANTNIIENDVDDSYMFRVSAKDRWVAQFLVEEGLARSENNAVAMIYENTGWGEGALPNVEAALAQHGEELVDARDFEWGDSDMTSQLSRMRDAGADTLIIWGLDREGDQILRSLERIDWDPVVLGAWGIAGNLGDLAGERANGVLVMQTYSWMGDLEPQAQELFQRLQEEFGIGEQGDIHMGSGIANAYDAVHIVAKAIEEAGVFEWDAVRDAMFEVSHEGLVTNYDPAFEAYDPDKHEVKNERHDAILPEAYQLTVWHNGELLPIEQTDY
ncbi:ABC transporter substrate-binding protein [Aquisalimonas asiatica]|uniref:Amino acid/amide ABC transporter substrate-binding protein, HAAT family (TC 3.A.1.4.-) n=1 Tax=Aquisalimonas asiatica TaxID=406100 RepID=A0A1H8RIV7_9GAMM|nr:ABC transporter substrate-binding protein [Aquisalimonas asiatica]SEO66187.1 amino acid/amide ABC transporter substrate-binding protein, HAAT family (TC 3.A.1.4.-) [Aquisalimonas asiatica]